MMLHPKPNSGSTKEAAREASVLGYLQGPRDAAVTLETAPVLEVPTALQWTERESGSGRLLDEHPIASICRGPFEEVAGEQLAATVDQLLVAYNVHEADVWAPIVTRLADEAAGMLSPARAVAYGNLDPRFYIKVKKVPGVGKPEDSCAIDGAVCRKNLAHKRMGRQISNPKILMVAKNLEFNRAQSRLTSLEGMTKQEEEEGLREQVDKLVALGPNVVLVEKSVARKAQDELLERGISLALNMKRPVLDFIARCTGAEVAPSADVATAKNLGTCTEFLVEDTYPAPPRPALSCISSSSSMTSVASAAPANKLETLNTLASAAERSVPHAQHAEPLEGHTGKLGSEQIAGGVPRSAFGQPGQQASAPSKADVGRQSAAAKPDASGAPLASVAAQQALAAAKALPASGQPGVNVPGQPHPHNSSSSSKLEASKGAMAARTLMFFKGSPCDLGCTVLLKGAPRPVLASVKKVMEFAVYAAYRNRLETAFLADELASAIPTAADCTSRPPSPKRAAGQGSAFGTPSRSFAGSPAIGSPSQQTEHLQITQPDGGTALASRPKDQRSSAPRDDAAASAADASLMSSLMASSAPGPKPHGEQQFSRAVSSARQDMGLYTPRGQNAQQQDSGKLAMLSTSPPFRDSSRSPEEGNRSNAALACGDECGVDLAGVDKAELRKHARRVVQRSAHLAAADRGSGPLTSLSAHVTVGAAEWSGNDVNDFAFEEEVEAAEQEKQSTGSQPNGTPPGHRSTGSRHEYSINGVHSRPGSAESSHISWIPEGFPQPEAGAGDGHDKLERQAEAGELLGLQRLYVCTALSNQPNGGLAEPLKVKRIDYYQRTDQALSQLLSGAAVDVNNPEVTTYLHGDGLLTLRMAQLPEGQGLPGADANQIWFWLRPRQASLELLGAARRVPLSRDAGAMSLGHFLEVSFGARHLSVGSRPLHAGYARYFGQGNNVACFLWERVGPVQVDMPPQRMLYYVPAQRNWVKNEVEELIEEANRIFGAIDSALKATEEIAAVRAALTQQEQPSQPAPRSHGAASPGSSQGNVAGDKLYGSSPESASHVHSAGLRSSDEDRTTPLKGSDPAAASAANGPSAPAADDTGSEAGFLSHLRSALIAEVSGLVENIQEVCALIRADATELAALSLADSPRKQANEEELLEGLTNEGLLKAVWRINSLQRSLSIMALTWASCLHDAAAAAYPGKLRQGSAPPIPPRTSGASLSQRTNVPAAHHSHSHSHSAPAELDVRVLLANAARSAPGSPKAIGGLQKQDTPFAASGQGGPGRAIDGIAAASTQHDTERVSPAVAVVENLSQLLRIISGELSGGQAAGKPKVLEAAAVSAADREAMGHLAKSIGSRPGPELSPERALSAPLTAPPLSRTSPIGRLGACEDDTESVVSAPGNVEHLHGASSGEGLDRAAPAQPVASRVSRYASMIEARNLMISMPAWDRPILRHNSTDLVLRFLNRHRGPRNARSASPEQPSADAPRFDSDNSSDSDDDADLDAPEQERPGARPDSLTVRTPPRQLSPPRSRRHSPPRSLERALSGPLKPSLLGDTSRAALAASESASGAGSQVLQALPPPDISACRVDLPQIDIANVRSNLSRGAGGALTPDEVLSPRALETQQRQGGLKAPVDAPQLAGREHSAAAGNAWGDESIPAAADIPHQDKQSPSAAAQSAAIDGKVSGMTQSEAQELQRALAREPSDVQGFFNTENWLRALRQSRDLDQDPLFPHPSGVPHTPSLESVSEVGAGPADEAAVPALSAQAPAPSRPASPAPSASAPSAQPPDDMRARLSLPPGVMRRAQQLPGAIPLPNGHQVEVLGRALLQPGVDERIVVVRDDEPTSLLAYTLSSKEHVQFLEEVRSHVLHNGPKPGAGQVLSRATLASRSSGDLAGHDDVAAAREDSSASAANSSAPAENPESKGSENVARAKKEVAMNGVASELEPEWMILTWPRPMHFEHTAVDDHPGLSGSRTKLSVTVWFPAQFAELRRICLRECGGEAAFCASLSRCHRWEPRGGKSNSFFAKTRDDRFIVKQLSAAERKSFQELAPNFFGYLGRAMRRGQPTCLAKIMGVFTVRVESNKAMDLLVMENVFYERSLAPVYDLKGSERARWCKDDPNDPTTVLLDENLKRDILSAPLLVEPAAHAALMKALWADTAFLAGQGVMDYSLLVGVDSPNGALVVGIIDFLRQYTWDKALERWVKSVGLGQDRGKAPTIQSPRDYCKRFRGAMAGYFTCVPAEGDVPAPLDVTADLAD